MFGFIKKLFVKPAPAPAPVAPPPVAAPVAPPVVAARPVVTPAPQKIVGYLNIFSCPRKGYRAGKLQQTRALADSQPDLMGRVACVRVEGNVGDFA
jgi:hypothetical protein